MNEKEKKLATMTAAQMGPDEYKRIQTLTSHLKRAMELFAMLPDASAEYEKDPEAFINKHNLNLTQYDIDYALTNKYDAKKKEALNSENYLDLVPESFFRIRQYIENKLYLRDVLRDERCAPDNAKLKKWRQRQINRCNGAIGGANESFIHAIACYEISKGCSVGCKFCGIGAKKLQKVFRYTPENSALFKGVLNVMKEKFGMASREGIMYLATEPLDNPEYELFENDYYEVFGYIPQITTAVADRNIDRTRALINELNLRNGFIHRFSVRSLEMAHTIFENFTPEELLLVELIPQYEEAPNFIGFTVVGNEVENQTGKNTKNDAGTICCIDGFCINFCDKTVKLFTPCHMDEDNPNGIAIAEEVDFEDAEDFANKIDQLMDKYIQIDLPEDEVLRIYYYYERRHIEQGDALLSKTGGEALLIDKLPKDVGLPVLELLLEGKYTKHEIVALAAQSTGAKPEKVFWMLNQFWNKGFIVDSKFFKR